jgi:recombinational DNA repair protein RecR
MAIYNKTLCVFSTTSDANKLDELRRNCTVYVILRGSMGTTSDFPRHYCFGDAR